MQNYQLILDHLISMIQAHQLDEEQIYQLGNKQKVLYAIVDCNGNIHGLRKGYGGAKRAIRSDRFCYFAQLLEEDNQTKQYYEVVPLHLEDVVKQMKTDVE